MPHEVKDFAVNAWKLGLKALEALEASSTVGKEACANVWRALRNQVDDIEREAKALGSPSWADLLPLMATRRYKLVSLFRDRAETSLNARSHRDLMTANREILQAMARATRSGHPNPATPSLGSNAGQGSAPRAGTRPMKMTPAQRLEKIRGLSSDEDRAEWLCSHFCKSKLLNGTCSYGEKCQFVHDLEQVGLTTDKAQTLFRQKWGKRSQN